MFGFLAQLKSTSDNKIRYLFTAFLKQNVITQSVPSNSEFFLKQRRVVVVRNIPHKLAECIIIFIVAAKNKKLFELIGNHNISFIC